ncbi:MAG: hypothetical protein H6726_28690 [Sandaracinaceae bacterium]|nr:hypothetical protein [Sandaracinaceae bacterium]
MLETTRRTAVRPSPFFHVTLVAGLLAAATLLGVGPARAQLFDTVDRSIAAGVASAPTPVSVGRGDGAGGVIGEDTGAGRATTMAFDSDVLGRVRIAVAGGGCTAPGSFAVIYFDSVQGGVASTLELTDIDTPEDAAISGGGLLMPSVSDLAFGPGFDADFAIAFTNTMAGASATLVALSAGAPHTPIGSLAATQSVAGVCSRLEITGLTLASLGLTQGDSFDWLATLLDGVSGARTNEFQGVVSPPATNPGLSSVTLTQGDFNRFDSVDRVLVNEVDSDSPGSDTAEFVELFGAGDTALDGALIVFFNGSGDVSYRSIDLDGFALNGAGYFFTANPGVAGAGITFANSTLQNGPDAVALYLLPSMTNGTTVSSGELVDALVYGHTAPATTLMVDTLTPGQMMIAEGGSAAEREAKSIQRCPNGAGAPRDTSAFQISAPSPGEANICAFCGDGFVDMDEECDDGTGVNGTGSSCCNLDCSFRTAGDVCTATSLDTCDAEDTCNDAGVCVDNVLGMGTVCNMAMGDCDVAEVCDGMSPSCPSDAVEPMGTECRPAMGDCDVAEACDGMSAECPVDVVAIGTTCRISTGECDPAEVCTGAGVDCPVDGFATDGALCGDTLTCNGQDMCMSGMCVAGTPPSCDDSNACTTDACSEPLGCENTPVADCCNVDGDCDDGDLCTADSCSGPGGTCGASPITDCCEQDMDCDDANLCTSETCNLLTNRCERAAVPNCCTGAADCDDANACTVDSCDVPTGTCSNTADPGCCLTDGDCGDGDTCTFDECDVTTNTCSNAPVAGCCVDDAECDDGDVCTVDSCVLALSMCSNLGVPGCGVPDGGVPDGGLPDGGGLDLGSLDLGSLDLGGFDDGGPADAGDTDGGGSDQGADEGVSPVDLGGRDLGVPDAAGVDAGVGPGGMSGGACAAGPVHGAGAVPLVLLVLGGVVVRRRRRGGRTSG